MCGNSDPTSTPAVQSSQELPARTGTPASTSGSTTESQDLQPTPDSDSPQQPPHGDPEEIDISHHSYLPQPAARFPAGLMAGAGQQSATGEQAQLHRMLMGLGDPAGRDGAGAFGSGNTGPGGTSEDQMTNLMMQLLGGGGGPGTAAAGMPPFSALGGQASPQGQGRPAQQQQQQAMLPDRYDSLWRVIHTALALGLGLYIALWTTFSGSKFEREVAATEARAGRSGLQGRGGQEFQQFGFKDEKVTVLDQDMANVRKRFFWAFATAEAVLLTTRFFLDRSRAQQGQGGVLSALVGFLPQPARGRLQAILRYKDVFVTVRRDVLVCVFVLGACVWLRS